MNFLLVTTEGSDLTNVELVNNYRTRGT